MGFVEQLGEKVFGVLKGLDRVRFRGTLRWLANERGLRRFTGMSGILLKDFGRWAEAKTRQFREGCVDRARALGIETIYLQSSAVDKEALARRIAAEKGIRQGPICQFSVVEPCLAPLVAGNKATKQLELYLRPRKCVWIYHYFDDPQVGFGHVRLQSWLPFGITICLNGRHWLEKQMQGQGLAYRKDGNCFPWIQDVAAAQRLMDEQLRTDWPGLLNRLTLEGSPALDYLPEGIAFDYYWSAEETEWASDVMFRSAAILDRLYPSLVRHAMVVSDSPAVMRYLGRRQGENGKKRGGLMPDEVISDCRRRYEGVRVKHWVNHNSVKLYNKCGNILRLETTINQTRDFKVFRCPDDDPSRPASWQKMRKGVSDLHRRCQVSDQANERYAQALGSARLAETLKAVVADACQRVTKNGKRYRALNPWQEQDFKLLSFLGQGQWAINGFRNKDLRAYLFDGSAPVGPLEIKRQSARTTRLIRLLRGHGLIKKVAGVSRYILTDKGQQFTTGLLTASGVDIASLMELAA